MKSRPSLSDVLPKSNIIEDVTLDGQKGSFNEPKHDPVGVHINNPLIPAQADSQEQENSSTNDSLVDDEGFQNVIRRKNKAKAHQTVCSLPSSLNARPPYKAGLSKFQPVRNVPKAALEKSKPKHKGIGGAPSSSSLDDK